MLSIYVWVALSLTGLTTCVPLYEHSSQRLRGLQRRPADEPTVNTDAAYGRDVAGGRRPPQRMLSDSTPEIQSRGNRAGNTRCTDNDNPLRRIATSEAESPDRDAPRRWRVPLKVRIRGREAKLPVGAPEEGQHDEITQPATGSRTGKFRARMRRLLNYVGSTGGNNGKRLRKKHVARGQWPREAAGGSKTAAVPGEGIVALAPLPEDDPEGAMRTVDEAMRNLDCSVLHSEDHTEDQQVGSEATGNALKMVLEGCTNCAASRHFTLNAEGPTPLQQTVSKAEPIEKEAPAQAAASMSRNTAGGTGDFVDDVTDKEVSAADASALARQEKDDAEARRQTKATVKKMLQSGIRTVRILYQLVDGTEGRGREYRKEDDAKGATNGKGLNLRADPQIHVGQAGGGAHTHPLDSAEEEGDSGGGCGKGVKVLEEPGKASDIELQAEHLTNAVFENRGTLIFTVEKPADETGGLMAATPLVIEEKLEEEVTPSGGSAVAQRNSRSLDDVESRSRVGNTPQADNTGERVPNKGPEEYSREVGEDARNEETRQNQTGKDRSVLLPPLPPSSAFASGSRSTTTVSPLSPLSHPARSYRLPQTHPAAGGRRTSLFAESQNRAPPVTVQLGVARAAYIEAPVVHRVPPLVGGDPE